jgi:hypothetical protein
LGVKNPVGDEKRIGNENGGSKAKGVFGAKGRDGEKGKRRVGDGGVNGTRGMDVVREILGTCEGTVVSLEAQIALYVGSEFIAKARQEKVGTTKKRCVKG